VRRGVGEAAGREHADVRGGAVRGTRHVVEGPGVRAVERARRAVRGDARVPRGAEDVARARSRGGGGGGGGGSGGGGSALQSAPRGAGCAAQAGPPGIRHRPRAPAQERACR
jgi:hypothetical protein